MRRQNKKNQLDKELSQYFEQARHEKCPPGMKKSLYQKIGINSGVDWYHANWFKPALAFSFVAVFSLGLVWQNHHQVQQDKLASAQRDMEIAMHYMQKISNKTLEDVNTHGIKPAIIVPVSKSISQMAMAQI